MAEVKGYLMGLSGDGD
jgi:hypothetical protein